MHYDIQVKLNGNGWVNWVEIQTEVKVSLVTENNVQKISERYKSMYMLFLKLTSCIG